MDQRRMQICFRNFSASLGGTAHISQWNARKRYEFYHNEFGLMLTMKAFYLFKGNVRKILFVRIDAFN